MGKTRDLFQKIRDTNGTFRAKLGSIKDRNGLDLTVNQKKRVLAMELPDVWETHNTSDKINGVTP